MPTIRPFAGVRYAKKFGPDTSKLIAPPYDVLSDRAKAALVARHPNNVVTVDLPHLPAKSVGPDEAYEKANTTFQAWLSTGVLERDRRAALYPYTQSYEHNGRTYHRRGMICLVRLSPFGEGQVFPHEQTYPDAIQDRLKLTRATGHQLSPIFGIFSDPRHEVNNLLYANLGKPEQTATIDGVRNDVWSVIDAETEDKVINAIGRKPIYIADGHHRYTMALAYQKEQVERNGGQPLPPNHPANFCMFVLVHMQDDGLIVLPTHRLVGGLAGFHVDTFRDLLGTRWDVRACNLDPDRIPQYVNQTLPMAAANTFGLFDGRTRQLYEVICRDPDVLKPYEPARSDAWRRLDVAILQRYLIDEVLKPKFAGGRDPSKAYTADPYEVAPTTDGERFQVAFLLKSTPLGALEQLSRHNEIMPPKSTFFYPKLATGMVMYPVR